MYEVGKDFVFLQVTKCMHTHICQEVQKGEGANVAGSSSSRVAPCQVNDRLGEGYQRQMLPLMHLLCKQQRT